MSSLKANLKRIRVRLCHDRRAELDEAAIVLPVLLLVTFGLINLAMLGFASMTANNAANYGARVASVTQANQAAAAQSAASSKLSGVTVGTYTIAVMGGGEPGAPLRVQVHYAVPNYFQGLTALFGVSSPVEFTGEAHSDFRQEGW